jgi:hypothetical protein
MLFCSKLKFELFCFGGQGKLGYLDWTQSLWLKFPEKKIAPLANNFFLHFLLYFFFQKRNLFFRFSFVSLYFVTFLFVFHLFKNFPFRSVSEKNTVNTVPFLYVFSPLIICQNNEYFSFDVVQKLKTTIVSKRLFSQKCWKLLVVVSIQDSNTPTWRMKRFRKLSKHFEQICKFSEKSAGFRRWAPAEVETPLLS